MSIYAVPVHVYRAIYVDQPIDSVTEKLLQSAEKVVLVQSRNQAVVNAEALAVLRELTGTEPFQAKQYKHDETKGETVEQGFVYQGLINIDDLGKAELYGFFARPLFYT